MFKIGDVCLVFDVSRSGFYMWLSRKPSKRALENKKLLPVVKKVFEDNRKVNGCVRLSEALKKEGIHIGVRRIRGIMTQGNLNPIRYTPSVRTTDSNHTLPKREDLENRGFSAFKPNEL